ncbi:hypothetical protein, partial [Aeromonas dhakensis]|uniref:hypothetical protein n=1 Tax=Aeromonas dhakensis TaxID=196024 RepID=UPI000FC27751
MSQNVLVRCAVKTVISSGTMGILEMRKNEGRSEDARTMKQGGARRAKTESGLGVGDGTERGGREREERGEEEGELGEVGGGRAWGQRKKREWGSGRRGGGKGGKCEVMVGKDPGREGKEKISEKEGRERRGKLPA